MKEKCKKLLKKNWIWPVAAFGIPFIVSVMICAGIGIYPFGESCVLHMDMYHQYCPFFMEFRDKLVEGGSLLYSWNLGLGSDFISLYAYYLASPLNWLLILCPEGLVIEFMTLTTWIKISLAGLFFYVYLAEHFHLKGKDGKYHVSTAVPALVFSTAYAFSGYVATYSWNVMWMDSIALAPLVILGLELLVKKNRPALYYVALALSILCNFYISMIICIFLVIYFVILFFEQKSGKIKAALRFAWYSLLAGGTGAILLIPEAKVLSYTASADTGLPESIEFYFNILEELSRMCIVAEPYTGREHWPNLYCGAFSILLILLYGMNRRISWKKKFPRIALLIFLLLSFATNYLDYAWHGLRFPNSLPARQSFLFIFIMLVLGYETYLKRNGVRAWQVVFSAAMCEILLAFSASVTSEDVTEPIAFVVTGIFILAYALCLVIYKLGDKKIRQLMKGFAFGLAMGEIILNMAITGFYSLNRTSYLAKKDEYEVLLEMADADAAEDAPEGGVTFYRVEDIERKTKNDDCLYGYPSGTIFSSLMNIDVSHFYQRVYMEGGRNYYCYNGATPVVSSMLSARYMLSDNNEGENALRELVGLYGGYYLYENKYCLPLGFMMSEDAIENWNNNQGQKITHLNELAMVLGAESDMLSWSNVDMVVSEGETTITVDEDGIYYGYYDRCTTDNLTISINGGAGTKYGKTSHRYLFEFGECKAGDEIKITNSKNEQISFNVYKLNLDAVDEAYRTLSQQTMVTEAYTDTTVNGYIDVTEAGRLILSIPNEEGWTLYVDGKETEIKDFKETFISVYLSEGRHTIELEYMTPGLKLGAILSGTCIGLFALTMFVRKSLKKHVEKNGFNENSEEAHIRNLECDERKVEEVIGEHCEQETN